MLLSALGRRCFLSCLLLLCCSTSDLLRRRRRRQRRRCPPAGDLQSVNEGKVLIAVCRRAWEHLPPL